MEDNGAPQVVDNGTGGSVVDEYGGDSRPPVYWDPEVERWVYRAYSLGNCVRALTAFRQGVTPADHPEWLMKAFREGHENESVILRLLYDNYDVYEPVEEMRQMLMELPVGTRALIRGHNDDVAIVQLMAPKEKRVVEAKAFAKSTLDKWHQLGFAGFPYYAVQLSIYMHMLQMPALFVIGLKDEETRVVTELEVIHVDEPPVPLAKIKAKVIQIENAADLPACDFNQYPCQMFFLGDENGCGGSSFGFDGRKLPKPTSKKRLEEIDLAAQLHDSVALERLNGPAEEIFEGTKLRNRGGNLVRMGEERLGEWESDNPKLAGDPGTTRKYTTTKWHITVHPVGGIAVRPKREGP